MHKDVLIIGAGPVGLFAIHQCGMLGLKVSVVDSLPEIGGQCSALYPEKPIYDIPAYPRIDGAELIHQLEEQAKPFAPNYYLGQSVTALSKHDDIWHVQTSTGQTLTAKAIIIAAGGGAFGPNRPPLDHLEDYEGKSVFYMVRRREDFRGKNVVIAGGGDSAVDWAISLAGLAQSVTIVHRRAKFRAAAESIRQMDALIDAGKITLCTPYQLKALAGDNGQISAIHIADMDGGEKILAADTLLAFFGLAAELGAIASWGLHIDGHTIAVDPATCQTNREGIFAIGDIASYPEKLKLILTGFADAAQAAHGIQKYLFPGQEFHQEYSTTKGLPTK